MWTKERQKKHAEILDKQLSDYLNDKNDQEDCGRKQAVLMRKLNRLFRNDMSDVYDNYSDWLCSIADKLATMQGNAQNLADIIYVEAYKEIKDFLISEAFISNSNFVKCEQTLDRWLSELDKDHSNPHYLLDKTKDTNEIIIRYCLDKVELEYENCGHQWPDNRYCHLAEKVLSYILYKADERFLQELMNTGKLYTLFERLDVDLLIEYILSLKLKIVKANSILNK